MITKEELVRQRYGEPREYHQELSNLVDVHLRPIEKGVGLLIQDMSIDRLVALQGYLAAVDKRVASMKELAREAMVAFLEESGPVQVGGVIYKAGAEPETKCTNVEDAVREILATDLDQLLSCLSAGAKTLRPATCKELMGEEFYQKHFTTTWKKDVRTGKTRKKVKVVDPKYLPGAKDADPET